MAVGTVCKRCKGRDEVSSDVCSKEVLIYKSLMLTLQNNVRTCRTTALWEMSLVETKLHFLGDRTILSRISSAKWCMRY